MKESFDFDNERNLNNIHSFLEGVGNIDIAEEHNHIDLQELELLLDDLQPSLSRLYNKIKFREEIFIYLSDKIVEKRKVISDSYSIVKNERLELLERFADLVEKQFGKRVKKDKMLSVKQKIIMMDYLGILKRLEESMNQKTMAKFISLITDGDSDNIVKAIRNNFRSVKSSAVETKTLENLQRVKKEFEDLGLSEIVNKIEADISEIK